MAETATQDTAAPDAAPTREQLDALVRKHQAEIDRVLVLPSNEQEAAILQYGLDPKALEAHYKPLIDQSEALKREDQPADTKAAATGWISFGAVLATMIAIRKKVSDSKLVQNFAVGLTSLAAGLVGNFIGSRIFAGRIREESKQLDYQASAALKRELAVVIENRELEKAAAVATGETPAPAGQDAGLTPPPMWATQRDASYAAQRALEKSIANDAARQAT